MNGKKKEQILKLINIHQESLWTTEIQAAYHGMNPPLSLINEMAFARKEIERLELALKKK
jgi:hypothetical protein